MSPISIHAPHTGRDPVVPGTAPRRAGISIHAPHTGRDPRPCPGKRRGTKISIHAPHTGRDFLCSAVMVLIYQFQSTRPIRGATVMLKRNDLFLSFQSTRPIRGATAPTLHRYVFHVFQSTRPIRGATRCSTRNIGYPLNFNPRAPYGARLARPGGKGCQPVISIHAPHTGRDTP